MLNITKFREMQIKTIMIKHLTSVRMAIIKKSANHKFWRRCSDKGTLLHCEWGCKLLQLLWRIVRKCLQNLKMATIWSRNPILGHISRGKRGSKDICILIFIAVLFAIAKIWEQLKCPLTYKWINNIWYIHTIEYYSTINKNEKKMPFATTLVGLEIIIGEGNCTPLQYSCLANPIDGGPW